MTIKLKFYSGGISSAVRESRRDTFVLTRNSWDDYGHKLLFELTYLDEGGFAITLGMLKVLKSGESGNSVRSGRETPLDVEFSNLSEEYVSLGQTEDYYVEIGKLGEKKADALLRALRDIAWSPAFASEFEPLSAFRNGLTRSNSAQRARRLGVQLVRDGRADDQTAFTYLHALTEDAPSVEVAFPFDSTDPLPGRIIGIVGRNAVGKTTFMARIGTDLAQVGQISEERLKAQRGRFKGQFPLFIRVLAVSYSAFDRFKRPDPDRGSSYTYLGIRDDKGQLSQRALRDSFARNKARVREFGREYDWVEAILTVLGETGNTKRELALHREIFNDSDVEDSFFEDLSSGQGILCHLVTGLLGWLQPNSIVLFDEPETHLHPNAVANLFQVLTEILKKTDSVAILATHSPVVIQEIPAKRVLWFNRDEDELRVTPLRIESFGESLSELTRQVFETVEIENLYKTVLARLARNEPLDAVLARFPEDLSMNAQAYLLAQYQQTDL